MSLLAQDTVKKMETTSLSVMPFGSIGSGNISTLEDFQKLAPNSTLLPDDLAGYDANNYTVSSGSLGTAVLLSFKLRDKSGSAYRPNPTFRIGMSYNYSKSLYNSAYKNERFAYDTLISVNTGEKTAVDSVSYTGYSMDYASQFVRLDASMIYRTNPKARWNFYGGFGATFGVSISSQTNINYSSQYYIQPHEDENSIFITSSGYNGEYESEITKNETSLAYSLYIPLGLDFRISNKNEFWQRVHLFYEMRPTLDMISIPELNTYTTVAWQQGFGVKVQWN
jgi:hypothetical protein